MKQILWGSLVRVRRWVGRLFLVLIFLLILYFAQLNTTQVEVYLTRTDVFNVSLILIVLGSFVVGVVSGLLIALLRSLTSGYRQKIKKKSSED